MRKSVLTLRTLFLVVLILILAGVVFSSYTIINPGHRGVVVRLGGIEPTVLVEGFHLIIPPVVRKVVEVDIRTKKVETQDTEAASSDLQAIKVTGVLNYHPDPLNVNRLYQEVGLEYESIIIAPAMQEAIKAATAQYRVEQILVERAVIKDLIQKYLTERLGQNHIIVDQFSLANVAFSAEFDKAIERKQVAEQAALQKQYELQSAQKDAEIAIARAEGGKKAAIIAAEGQAEALRLIADQLRNNAALIQYEWASKLAPTVTTVLLPTDQSIIMDAKTLVGK